MSEYSEELSKVKDTFTNILKDNIYLCEKSVLKSNLLLRQVEELSSSNIDGLNTDLQKLLDRMSINLTAFNTQQKDAISAYENFIKNNNNNSPRKKYNLSLRKNGETRETDIDLTCSDEENVKSSKQETTAQVSEQKLEVIPENNDVKGEESDSSDDSQKTIPIGNFDVAVLNNSREDCEETLLEMKESLNGFINEDSKKDGKDNESQSFDFDDDEDLNTKLEKVDIPEVSVLQNQQDNNELLELLNKATDNLSYPDYPTTEQEGEEALKMLEESSDVEYASCSDSDDSDVVSLLSMGDVSDDDDDQKLTSEDDSDGKVEESSDEEIEEEITPEKCQEVSINLTRVDDDGEIDRLCNLHNLNKRKCTKEIRSHCKRKRRRITLLSTSSSSSAEESSSGSTTPDLDLREVELLPPIGNGGSEAMNLLAEEICNRFEAEENEINFISSDSEVEEVSEPKKKRSKETTDGEEEDKSEKPKKRRERASWEYDPLLVGDLWSDTESEGESKKSKPVDNESPKKSKEDNDCTIISDKESKEDNDYTIISDSCSDTDSDLAVCDPAVIIDDDDDGGEACGRKNIRSLIPESELNILTQKAKTEEDERIQRLEEHTKTLEMILSQHDDFVLDFDVNTNQPIIVVDQKLARKLKPHQKDGVQFMWEACYESVEMLKKINTGTGCILAHCMGLGKTLQVITLIHTLFVHKLTKTKHVLIVCPLSTVSNWQNEFRMAFNLLDNQPDINLFFLIREEAIEKYKLIRTWRVDGGVVVMGYEAFQRLSCGKSKKNAKDVFTEDQRRNLREALIDPGPDLVICDEGHLLKNVDAQRSQSLMQIKTKRRIVLTGTPLQNNLTEYYYMVDFVKTHLLGTYPEYNNRFANPIMNGQYGDSRPEDIKLMKKRTHVLTSLLKKTIHRVETSILQSYLPAISDYTIFVKPEPLQIELYKKYIELAKAQNGPAAKSACFFQDFRVTKYITLHPYGLSLYYAAVANKKGRKKKSKETVTPDDDLGETTNLLKDWHNDLLPPDVAFEVNYSSKLKVILAIINEAVKNGEKVLLFAHQLIDLDLIEHFLKTQGTSDYRCWTLNMDYYRMDGEVNPSERNGLCNNFNVDPDVKLFLISHGVGGLGLNLTGANRVILVGSNHNPSTDTQSIYRVYRFGQNKRCFVYRILTIGAMEEKIYHRCVAKLAVAGTVVDKYHFDRHYKCRDLQAMYEYNFDLYAERPIPSVPTDKLLAKLLQNNEDIYKYHEHTALLANRPEEELNDEEKKLAWEEFKREEEREEAAKNAALLPHPIHKQSFMLNRPPIVPLDLSNPSNRLEFRPPRANGPSMVANPLNLNGRGLVRAFFNQGQTGGNSYFNMLRPNMPLSSGIRPQPSGNISDIPRPSVNGLNRYFVNNQQQSNYVNPFLKLLMDSNKNEQSNQRSVIATTRVNPSSSRNQPQESVNLVDEVPAEFNYALNKVV